MAGSEQEATHQKVPRASQADLDHVKSELLVAGSEPRQLVLAGDGPAVGMSELVPVRVPDVAKSRGLAYRTRLARVFTDVSCCAQQLRVSVANVESVYETALEVAQRRSASERVVDPRQHGSSVEVDPRCDTAPVMRGNRRRRYSPPSAYAALRPLPTASAQFATTRSATAGCRWGARCGELATTVDIRRIMTT